VGVAPSTIRRTLQQLRSAGFSRPLPAEATDSALEATLFTAVGTEQGHRRRAEPDWSEIHRELKRKHVTIAMLWDEYVERQARSGQRGAPTQSYKDQFCAAPEVGCGVSSAGRADARCCCRFSFSSFLASFARFRSARSNR
jgi:hypothetical protein